MIPAAELSASKPAPQRRYTQMRHGLVSISAAIVLAFAFTSVQAQQATPTAQPTPATAPAPAPTFSMSEKAAPGWKQSDWNIIRGQCIQLAAELAARSKTTLEQRKSLPPLTPQQMSLIETCRSLSLWGLHRHPYTPGPPLATPVLPPRRKRLGLLARQPRAGVTNKGCLRINRLCRQPPTHPRPAGVGQLPIPTGPVTALSRVGGRSRKSAICG
jgi:hypothetical protein